MKKKSLLAGLLPVLVFFATALGQSTTEADRTAKFISRDGGFSIELPRTGYDGIEPIGELSSGAGSYAWETANGHFTVSYIVGAVRMEETTASLNALVNGVSSTIGRSNGRVAGKRVFNHKGNSAVEIKVRRPGIFSITRFVIAKDTLFVFTAEVSNAKGELDAQQIFDSFELIDFQSLIA